MTRDSIAPEARAVELRKSVLPRAAAYLAWARDKGMPVVFVCSARRRTGKWFLKFWELANEIWQPGQQPIAELYKPDQAHAARAGHRLAATHRLVDLARRCDDGDRRVAARLSDHRGERPHHRARV